VDDQALARARLAEGRSLPRGADSSQIRLEIQYVRNAEEGLKGLLGRL
jgi:hypothetical protein